MSDPMTTDDLTEMAGSLGFELVAAGRSAAEYALLYGNEVHAVGTARDCAAFLTGWGALRARVLGELHVTDVRGALALSSQAPRGAGQPEVLGGELPRDQRQAMIAAWAETAFGREEATGIPQRGLRLLEEAIELFQACGGSEALARKLVGFVFDRPPGTIGQELGGVAVTVLALAAAAGLSADEEECREVHRVLTRPVGEFTRRNADKNAAGFKISTQEGGCKRPGDCDP